MGRTATKDFSDAQLRLLLTNMRVQHSGARNRQDLEALVKKAIKSVERLDQLPGAKAFDPRQLPVWPDAQPVLSEFNNFTLAEDGDSSRGVIVDVQSVRRLASGAPVLECKYLYSEKEHLTEGEKAAITDTLPPIGRNGQLSPMQSVICELEEVQVFRRVLETNAARLSCEYVQQCHETWLTADGHYKPSFLVPAVPLPEEQAVSVTLSRCAACGAGSASARCAQCKTVVYCSRDCQRGHWKQHKAACRAAVGLAPEPAAAAAPAASAPARAAGTGAAAATPADAVASAARGAASATPADGASVTINMLREPHPFGFHIRQCHSLNMSVADARAGRGQPVDWSSVQPNVYGRERFMVKVQRPLDAHVSDLLLYDKQRSLTLGVPTDEQPAHATLLSLIRRRGWQGTKAYFWAQRDSDTVLRVFVDGMPPQQQPW